MKFTLTMIMAALFTTQAFASNLDSLIQALGETSNIGNCSYQIEKVDPVVIKGFDILPAYSLTLNLPNPVSFEYQYGYKELKVVKFILQNEPKLKLSRTYSGDVLLYVDIPVINDAKSSSLIEVLNFTLNKDGKILYLRGTKQRETNQGVLKEFSMFNC